MRSKCKVSMDLLLCCRLADKCVVLLQAMREDPPLDARCRDKFLVQSIAITPERDLGSVTAIVS